MEAVTVSTSLQEIDTLHIWGKRTSKSVNSSPGFLPISLGTYLSWMLDSPDSTSLVFLNNLFKKCVQVGLTKSVPQVLNITVLESDTSEASATKITEAKRRTNPREPNIVRVLKWMRSWLTFTSHHTVTLFLKCLPKVASCNCINYLHIPSTNLYSNRIYLNLECEYRYYHLPEMVRSTYWDYVLRVERIIIQLTVWSRNFLFAECWRTSNDKIRFTNARHLYRF